MPLSQEEINGCREAFNKFDKDGSGTIDASELKATLNAVGQSPSDEEIFQMISQVDDDNSGEIEFSEFLKVIENQKVSAAQEFGLTIDLDRLIREIDTDGSGKVDYEEFKAMMA